MNTGDKADQWGNEWAPDALPGAVEIANVFQEAWQDYGTGAVFGADQFRVCPRVRLQIDGYQDRDYESAFLFTVITRHDDVTVLDHLAVYYCHDKSAPYVEWRQSPRLFFSGPDGWGYEGMRWWINWIESLNDMRHKPEDQAALAEHNRKVQQEEIDRARAAGIVLPYMSIPKSLTRERDTVADDL